MIIPPQRGTPTRSSRDCSGCAAITRLSARNAGITMCECSEMPHSTMNAAASDTTVTAAIPQPLDSSSGAAISLTASSEFVSSLVAAAADSLSSESADNASAS